MHNLQNYIKDTIRVYTEYFSFETIKNVTNNNSIVKINQINDNWLIKQWAEENNVAWESEGNAFPKVCSLEQWGSSSLSFFGYLILTYVFFAFYCIKTAWLKNADVPKIDNSVVFPSPIETCSSPVGTFRTHYFRQQQVHTSCQHLIRYIH